MRDWMLERSITESYVEKEKNPDCFNIWFCKNAAFKYQGTDAVAGSWC